LGVWIALEASSYRPDLGLSGRWRNWFLASTVQLKKFKAEHFGFLSKFSIGILIIN
jgi:hypothetical protein